MAYGCSSWCARGAVRPQSALLASACSIKGHAPSLSAHCAPTECRAERGHKLIFHNTRRFRLRQLRVNVKQCILCARVICESPLGLHTLWPTLMWAKNHHTICVCQRRNELCAQNKNNEKHNRAFELIERSGMVQAYNLLSHYACQWRIYKGDWGDISPGPEGKKAH